MTRLRIVGLVVSCLGILAGVALPFAPVFAETATVTWPRAGEPPASTTALFVPYRPADLTAELPCRAARTTGAPITVLATGPGGAGLTVTATGSGAHVTAQPDLDVRVPIPERTTQDCRVSIHADGDGVTVTGVGGFSAHVADARVPEVSAFVTELDPSAAAGLSVTAHTQSPFPTSPTAAKLVLVGVQLAAALLALVLLSDTVPRLRRVRPRRAWWVDGAVIGTLCGWAVIGPLAVDDGWATMIARTYAETGTPGNYYRWWNAAEVPFALIQQVQSAFTSVTLAPLWLRVPSTVLGVATWLALSRGVLAAALPVLGRSARVRMVAGLLLLAAWLPFNLGARPESYVASGVTAALALLWRARTSWGIGCAALVAGVTVAVSPTAVILAGPLLVLAPRAFAVLRRGATGRMDLLARVAAISCLGAVGLTVVFADQTWDALRTATDWHTFFGPTLPWHDESVRYGLLLGSDQQGSFAKRLPVLVGVAMVPVVATLAVRYRDRTGRAGLRLAAMVVISLAALALVPSKWSYHLGSMAGLLAAFLTASVVLVVRRAASGGRVAVGAAVVATAWCAGAVGWAFAGPNAWWLPALYDVPWASEPITMLGIPLRNPLCWIVFTAAGCGLAMALRRWPPGRAVRTAPAVVVVIAAATSVAVLLGSFVAAPLRRPEGALASANLDRLPHRQSCGLADDVEVLPDGPVLEPAETAGQVDGFAAETGFYPGAPPPDQPGTGTSAFLWGSRTPGADAVGTLTSPWFVLPALSANAGVAVSVSGRTDGANELAFEFGRADAAGVTVLGERSPHDRVPSDELPDHPLWRSIGVDADAVPPGTDRVRVVARDDRTDPSGWLAVTGPRLRSIVPLDEFLVGRGPVLLAWPQAFLFPCVTDVPVVADGLAQTPGAIIESPRPFFTDDRNPEIGGSFAGATAFGGYSEVPSRIVGHPELDWGAVRVASHAIAHDRYDVTLSRSVVPGIGGIPHQVPERPR